MKEIFDELNQSPGVAAPSAISTNDIVRSIFFEQIRLCILRGNNCPNTLKAKVTMDRLSPQFVSELNTSERAALSSDLLWEALSATLVNGDRPNVHRWLRERNASNIPEDYRAFNNIIDTYVSLLAAVFSQVADLRAFSQSTTTTTAQANILPQVFNQLYNAS